MDENGDLTPEEAVKLLPPVLIKDVTEIADVCGEIGEYLSCFKNNFKISLNKKFLSNLGKLKMAAITFC